MGAVCSSSIREAANSCMRAIDHSSHAGYRSILALTSLAYTRADLLERRVPPAPIRMPEQSSRLSGQRRILFTTDHERLLVTSLRRLYFSEYICPPHLSVFGHRAILIWRIETWLGVIPRTTGYLLRFSILLPY